jgi:hypothetical protein
MHSIRLFRYGAVKIAKALKAERIINPSAYKAKNGDTRFSRYNDNQNPKVQILTKRSNSITK